MRVIEWSTEDRAPHENDLWKLFSDQPDQPAETVLFYRQLAPLLRKMRLKDETRLYHVYGIGDITSPPESVPFRATVTQRNLGRVAAAIAGRGPLDVAIQYLGRSEKAPAHPAPRRRKRHAVRRHRRKPKSRLDQRSSRRTTRSTRSSPATSPR